MVAATGNMTKATAASTSKSPSSSSAGGKGGTSSGSGKMGASSSQSGGVAGSKGSTGAKAGSKMGASSSQTGAKKSSPASTSAGSKPSSSLSGSPRAGPGGAGGVRNTSTGTRASGKVTGTVTGGGPVNGGPRAGPGGAGGVRNVSSPVGTAGPGGAGGVRNSSRPSLGAPGGIAAPGSGGLRGPTSRDGLVDIGDRGIIDNSYADDDPMHSVQHLMERGWSLPTARAMVGNFQVESGDPSLNPLAAGDFQNGMPTAMGIGQWRGDRLNALENEFGAFTTDKRGKIISGPSLDAQLDFADRELKGLASNKDPGAERFASKVLSNPSMTVTDRTMAFAKDFERPSTTALGTSKGRRVGGALALGDPGASLPTTSVAAAPATTPVTGRTNKLQGRYGYDPETMPKATAAPEAQPANWSRAVEVPKPNMPSLSGTLRTRSPAVASFGPTKDQSRIAPGYGAPSTVSPSYSQRQVTGDALLSKDQSRIPATGQPGIQKDQSRISPERSRSPGPSAPTTGFEPKGKPSTPPSFGPAVTGFEPKGKPSTPPSFGPAVTGFEPKNKPQTAPSFGPAVTGFEPKNRPQSPPNYGPAVTGFEPKNKPSVPPDYGPAVTGFEPVGRPETPPSYGPPLTGFEPVGRPEVPPGGIAPAVAGYSPSYPQRVIGPGMYNTMAQVENAPVNVPDVGPRSPLMAGLGGYPPAPALGQAMEGQTPKTNFGSILDTIGNLAQTGVVKAKEKVTQLPSKMRDLAMKNINSPEVAQLGGWSNSQMRTYDSSHHGGDTPQRVVTGASRGSGGGFPISVDGDYGSATTDVPMAPAPFAPYEETPLERYWREAAPTILADLLNGRGYGNIPATGLVV